jgi:hypothetical protein
MRDKRVKLFNDFLDLANKRGEIDQFENKFKDYNGWESFNFKNDQSVTDLYNKTIKLGIFSSSSKLEDFFKKFACDILKTSTYCIAGGSSTTTPETSIFDCLLKDPDLKFVKSHNYVRYDGVDDDTKKPAYWAFFSNNRFHSSFSKKNGSWSCDGTDAYIIKLDDGNTYSSKTNKWTTSSASSSSSSNTTTITDTNLTGDDLMAGKFVKVGMRGDIVTKIQELLIAKGFIHVSKNDTPDGIFGNRTKRMVMAFQAANGLKDDGAVGKDTWPKLNDGSAVSNSSTNQSTSAKDPYEVPGSDSSIMQESRKKILRKYLQEFK